MKQAPTVVVTGPAAEAGLRDSLASAFASTGCAVRVLDFTAPSRRVIAAAAYRLPRLAVASRHDLRQRAEAMAEEGGADLVLVVKGALADPRTIELLRSRFDCPVVCWNPDSPFDDAISNCGGGIPAAIAAYDTYVTWAADVAERLTAVAKKVLVIPFGWDPAIMRPTAGRGEAAGRVVFIGTGTRQRLECLRGLAHLRPLVFGTHWPRVDGLEVRPPVRGAEFCRIVGEASWNINLLRSQNARSHNMRTFELIGAGGTQIAPQTDDHERFLGNDSQTVLFESMKDLESILRSGLPARQPRPRGLLEAHTYDNRVRTLLSALGIWRP